MPRNTWSMRGSAVRCSLDLALNDGWEGGWLISYSLEVEGWLVADCLLHHHSLTVLMEAANAATQRAMATRISPTGSVMPYDSEGCWGALSPYCVD